MSERYIICMVDYFIGGVWRGAYQVYERDRDFNHEYYALRRGGGNEPVTLGKARVRLERLQREESDDTGSKAGM